MYGNALSDAMAHLEENPGQLDGHLHIEDNLDELARYRGSVEMDMGSETVESLVAEL